MGTGDPGCFPIWCFCYYFSICLLQEGLGRAGQKHEQLTAKEGTSGWGTPREACVPGVTCPFVCEGYVHWLTGPSLRQT